MSFRMNDDLNEELLGERLQILLHRLGWSYVNLWTLNPPTRVLEWKRGHFEAVNAKAGAREYAKLFYTTYKPCCFTPGVGAVGRSYLEGKLIWLNGDAVCQHAGSVEQWQFLQCAEIKTTMCIPWIHSVLEIGTTNVVAENLGLTDRIQQVLANDLVPVAPVADFDYASTHPGPVFPCFDQDDAPREDHLMNLAVQQVWRSADNLNSDVSERQPNAHTDTGMGEETLAFGHEAGAAGKPEIVMNQALNQSHGLMTDQYRSLWSGGGEGEDSSARTYSVSPELQQQIHANPGFSPDDSLRTSTSDTLHIHFPGPRNLSQMRRTNSCGDQYEIQKHRTLYEAQEMHHQWRQQLLNSSPELVGNSDATADRQNLPLQESWQRDLLTSPNWQVPIANPSDKIPKRLNGGPRSNAQLVNQVSKFAGPLLRGQSLSALEFLKDVEKYQKEAAAEVFNAPYDVKPGHDVREPPTQITGSSPKGQRRSQGVELTSFSGRVHAGHDEAAANHMLAERRRRKRQKDNFTTLRKLVPIISKADKASTLIDTITYLKLLQIQIRELEASKEDIDKRCAVLENKCKGLRERNQELVEMLAKDQAPSSAAMELNLVHLNLKSVDSS